MLDYRVEKAFVRQAEDQMWRLVCLKENDRLVGFLMRSPDGAVGLYRMAVDDGREGLHSDANPPNPVTVTEGWRVVSNCTANFCCRYVIEAPGGHRLIFDNNIERLPRSERKWQPLRLDS